MRVDHKRRWLAVGAVFSAGAAGVTFSVLTIFAGAGIASANAKPVNTERPSISGTPQLGQRLTGDRGDWSNNPTAFAYAWARCATNGGSCAAISGARSTSYLLTSADVGNTIRFFVGARNAADATGAVSPPTAVIAAAPRPIPPRGSGCPSGSGNPDQVGSISSSRQSARLTAALRRGPGRV
jgi:hypothetical protein